jgi:hypothetical protein
MSTITADTFLVTSNSNGVLRELGGNVANRIPFFNSSSAITTNNWFTFSNPTGLATLNIPGLNEGATGGEIRINGGRTKFTSTLIGGLNVYVGNGQTGQAIDQSKQIIFRNNGRTLLTMLGEGATTTGVTASTRAAFTSRVSIDTGTTPLTRDYWGTNGVAFQVVGRPWIDITSTGGTRTDLAYTSFGIPTFSALSGTNYNGIYTVYIDGPPTLSTNVSGTTYALYSRTGNILFGGLQSNTADTRILTSTSSGLIRYRNFSDFSGTGITADTYTTGGTYTNTGPTSLGQAEMYLGYYPGDVTVTGYISNLRVINGTAIYTSGFSVPTSPLTAVNNTVLLTCQDATLRDNSTNNYTITANGNAAVNTLSPVPFGVAQKQMSDGTLMVAQFSEVN